MKQFAPFLDPIGRISDKPSSQEQGITENAFLFMGEAALLLSELNQLSDSQINFIKRQINNCTVELGLFRRHPEDYQQSYSIPMHGFSHDEQNGIAMYSIAIGNPWFSFCMSKYLDAHNNQYCDIYPGSDFFNSFKKAPIQSIKKLKAYLDDYKAHPEDTNSVDLRHDGDIVALTSIRQPRDLAFWQLAAGEKPSLFSVLWLCIAIMLCTRSTITDGSRGGTMLMAWFRNVAIKKIIPKVGFSGILLKLAMSIFDRILVKKYGPRFPEVLINAYFDRIGSNGERHPMIALVGKYLDKFPIDI